MRRGKWILSALTAVGLVTGLVVWQSSGQQVPVIPVDLDGPTDRDGNAGNPAPAAAKPSKPDSPLPIRQVVLFNSGVGYLQREGEVDGDARIELAFPAGDINDLLKSLILQDHGGRVGSVNYDSHDPIDKILHSFAVDLNNNPTLGQILNQVRGEKVDISLPLVGFTEPHKVGTIVGMETKRLPAKNGTAEYEYVNLSCDNGLNSIPLEDVKSIRFLNPVLEKEFQRALRVLAGAHDANKKTVSLGFNGQGKRAVKVGYVIEHPIWKTTYRLRVEPSGKVFMQGWAVVENTSDDDWNDVRMVLVSGRPISYKMNLYEPLYIPRPEVEPELFASLRPQVYSGAINDPMRAMQQGGIGPIYPYQFGGPPMGMGGPPMGMPPAMTGIPSPSPYDYGYGQNGAPGGGQGPMPMASAPALPTSPPAGAAPPPGYGASPQGYGAPFYYPEINIGKANLARGNLFDQKGNKLTYEELQRRREFQMQQQAKAKQDGAAIAGLNFKEGIASVASAEEVGDFYQYVLDQKITLPRQKSAMLPILDQTIEGTKVSIFNEATHAKYPLLGLKLKNTSKQHLSQGPITVYEDGSYAGDTRILDLQPNEERLLSYALDQAVEIKSDVKTCPSPDMNLKIGEPACVTANYKMRKTRTYTLKNRAGKDRTVILEHPIRPVPSAMPMMTCAPENRPQTQGRFQTSLYYPAGAPYPTSVASEDGPWKLIEPSKPLETTRDHYRFQVVVPAGKTVSFDVVEEQQRTDQLALHGNQPRHLAQSGVEINVQTVGSADKLLSLKIDKGLVVPTFKTRLSKTYFVQNNSDVDRKLTVDHLTCAGWVRLDDQGQAHKGPAAFHFVLPIPRGKTATREVIEERTWAETGTLVRGLSETAIREYLASPVPSAEVKAVFTKYLAMNAKLAETQKRIQEQTEQLKQLSDDQARLRENLKIIPQSSEPYKKFLDKFVHQEGEIEGFQKQLRLLQTTLQQQQREMDAAFASPGGDIMVTPKTGACPQGFPVPSYPGEGLPQAVPPPPQTAPTQLPPLPPPPLDSPPPPPANQAPPPALQAPGLPPSTPD